MRRTPSLYRRWLTVSAAVAVSLPFLAAPAHAEPIAATGVRVVVENEEGSATCTLGPRVLIENRMAFLTSAHCAVNHRRTEVYIDRTHVGTITHAGSPDAALTDYAIVEVRQDAVAYQIDGGINQSSIVGPEQLTPETVLCKVGGTTGRTCGKFRWTYRDGTIDTTIPADHGDSGAAVFVLVGESEAGIVGLVSRGNDERVIVTPIRQALLATKSKLSTYNG